MLNLALVSLKCLHLKIFFSWNKWFPTNFTRFGWSYNSCERTGRTGFFVFLHFKFNLLKNFCEVNQVKHFIRFKTFKVGIHDRFLFYFIQFYPRWQNTKMIDNYKKPLSNHLLIIPQRRLSPSRNNGRFQSKGTPQKKKSSKLFKNRLIGFRRVENYFVKKFLGF